MVESREYEESLRAVPVDSLVVEEKQLEIAESILSLGESKILHDVDYVT